MADSDFNSSGRVCAADFKADYFFSSVFGAVTGGTVGAMSPPFEGATAAGGLLAGFAASGGASSVQPATNAVASVRLESIAEALIPNLTFTGALLECCVKRQIVSISLPQLTHAPGP